MKGPKIHGVSYQMKHFQWILGVPEIENCQFCLVNYSKHLAFCGAFLVRNHPWTMDMICPHLEPLADKAPRPEAMPNTQWNPTRRSQHQLFPHNENIKHQDIKDKYITSHDICFIQTCFETNACLQMAPLGTHP